MGRRRAFWSAPEEGTECRSGRSAATGHLSIAARRYSSCEPPVFFPSLYACVFACLRVRVLVSVSVPVFAFAFAFAFVSVFASAFAFLFVFALVLVFVFTLLFFTGRV